MKFWRKPSVPTHEHPYDPSYWIDTAKRDYISALIALIPSVNGAALDALTERIELALKYWAGDYEYESEAVLDSVNDKIGEFEKRIDDSFDAKIEEGWSGMADIEARLDALEAVDTRSPLSLDEIGTVIDSHLAERPPVDLTEINRHLDTLAATAMQHRDRLQRLEGPAGMTNVEVALVEVMQEHEAARSDSDVAVEDGACPPHHWKIDALDGEDTVGGTCKKCGMRREDFTPTVDRAAAAKAEKVKQEPQRCRVCGNHPRSQAHADACNGGVRAPGGTRSARDEVPA